MSEPHLDLSDPHIYALASAALVPGLRSLLLLDAQPMDIGVVADLLAKMLVVVTGRSIAQVTLGSAVSEDDLWGSYMLSEGGDGQPLVWQTGLLGDRKDGSIVLAVIPDLSRLSLPAVRAGVLLMDAGIANLERHGQSLSWSPDICWVAGCSSSDLGKVSPHLVDRFALRLFWHQKDRQGRERDILTSCSGEDFAKKRGELAVDAIQALRDAALHWARFTCDALERMSAYFPASAASNPRRQITLMRLATATARIEGTPWTTGAHVDRAAHTIGLPVPMQGGPNIPPAIPVEPPLTENTVPPEPPPSVVVPPVVPEPDEEPTVSEPVYQSDSLTAFTATVLPVVPQTPYLEDYAPLDRPMESLRFPHTHPARAGSSGGPVVGTQRAYSVQDLAIVSTLLEAAKYQAVRRKSHWIARKRMRLSAADLRCYRRSAVPTQMLLVLLDYTSLHGCTWFEALIRHLDWAYEKHASVCLIRVGARDARDELRAERIVVQSVLVPGLSVALETGAGRATPLPHGLDQSLQTVRNALQHGRSALFKIRFVVVSDGRANIPLKASQTGQMPQRIGREAVEDAVQVAQGFRGLKDIEVYYLNPQPQLHAEIPVALAAALGAKTFLIPKVGKV